MGENRGGRKKEKTGHINPCKVVAKDQIILVQIWVASTAS